MKHSVYENWNWPYEQALSWMQKAKITAHLENHCAIGLGCHPKDIVTLGRHATSQDIINLSALKQDAIEIIHTDRGGGATVHGPGQIVVYPVINLKLLNLSIPDTTSRLESALISCLAQYDIRALRQAGEPGVYVDGAKIGSIGFRVSNGILTHGISLNVTNKLSVFSHIATCRKVNATITSMAALVGETFDIRLVGRLLAKKVISNLELN